MVRFDSSRKHHYWRYILKDQIRNAIIKKAYITNEDYGILTAWLDLDYGGAGQGFGGFALYTKEKDCTGFFITRCMEIAGVNDWEDMRGKPIRVLIEDDLISAIGHFIEDKWFNPKKEFGEKDRKKRPTASDDIDTHTSYYNAR